jgi:hypothetical protein
LLGLLKRKNNAVNIMRMLCEVIEEDGDDVVVQVLPPRIDGAAPEDLKIFQFFYQLQEEARSRPGLDPDYPRPFKLRSKDSDQLVAFDPYEGRQCYQCRGRQWAETHLHHRHREKKDGPWHGLPIEQQQAPAEHQQLSLL